MDLEYLIGYLIGLGSILFTAQPLIRGLQYESNGIAPNLILDAGAALEAWKRGNYTAEQLVKELTASGLNGTRIAVLQLLQETLLASGDAVNALYRGTITQADFNKQMEKLGFSKSSVDTMIANFESRLGAGDLFEAEHRNIAIPSPIGDSEKELYAQGFTKERVAVLRQLALRIPQLQDLFTMASWGVFDPKAVADGGLDQGKPDGFYDRAFAAGYDKPTADLFWSSHWTPPPVFILHTLFQTGQLSEDDLAYFLKVAQHPPGFIPKIVKAFYKQVSESQIVNFLQNGIIQESDVDALLKNNGYSPAAIALIHRDVMIKASLPSAEEKAAAAAQKAQFKSLSVGNVMASYEDGIISGDDVRTYLGDLEIAPDIISFQIKHSDFKIAKRELNDNITQIGDQFMLGNIDQSAALAQLSAIGVSAVKQSNLIVKWTKAVPVKGKLPTKVELDTFLKDGLIDLQTYIVRMEVLGYAYDDIVLFIAAATKKTLAQTEINIAANAVSGDIIP